MKRLAFAARSLKREFRQAELALLAAALVLAVAALAAVATLAHRVEHALVSSAAELIGGDLSISANQPLPSAFVDEARRRGLATNALADFPSVLFAGDASRLCEVRASDAAFPLRGALTVRDADGVEHAAHAPAAGSLYVDADVLRALDVAIGARVQLGDRTLAIAGVIAQSPDSGNPLRLAPRVLMNRADAQASGLLGAGSRARYRLLLAGSEGDVSSFAAWAKTHLPDGAEITTVRDAQQNLRGAFERGESFLRLAALLAALLSGIAIALAAQRFARRKIEDVALLRCLGASRAEILAIVVLELLLLALPACLIGMALGLGLQQIVLDLASGLLPGAPPPLPWAPALTAFAVGLAVLFGFALPPLLRLREVEPMRVFRRDVPVRLRRFDALYLLPLGVAGVLLLFGAANLRLATTLAAGLAGIGVATLAIGVGVLALLRMASTRLHGALRFGLANLQRRRALTLLQAGALALSLTAFALLGVVGPSLLQRWRADLPADTPNWFAINLQADQRAPFEQRLQAIGATNLDTLPIAVGKLIAINGRAPTAADYPDRRAAGWINGELRLSWSAQLPAANTLIEGAWFVPSPEPTATSLPLTPTLSPAGRGRKATPISPEVGKQATALPPADSGGQAAALSPEGKQATASETIPPGPQLSVEQMWVDIFHLKLGDTLTLRVGEREITAVVASIRRVEWESFHPNFFLMLDPASGTTLPHSFVASFHLAGAAPDALAALSHDYPNLSLIDLNALLARVRDIIERVTQAVAWVLGFSLAAGVLVLLAALSASADERRIEAALLRTLGAQRGQLSIAVLSEFAVLGLLAGIIAVVGAGMLGTVLGRSVFKLDGYTPPLLPLIGIVAAAAILVALIGWLGSWRITRTSPMAVLRRG